MVLQHIDQTVRRRQRLADRTVGAVGDRHHDVADAVLREESPTAQGDTSGHLAQGGGDLLLDPGGTTRPELFYRQCTVVGDRESDAGLVGVRADRERARVADPEHSIVAFGGVGGQLREHRHQGAIGRLPPSVGHREQAGYEADHQAGTGKEPEGLTPPERSAEHIVLERGGEARGREGNADGYRHEQDARLGHPERQRTPIVEDGQGSESEDQRRGPHRPGETPSARNDRGHQHRDEEQCRDRTQSPTIDEEAGELGNAE